MNNFPTGQNMNMNSPAAGMYNAGSPFIRLRNFTDGVSVWELSLSAEVIIGRQLECDVCLSDLTVSRRHCRIFYRSDIFVENLSSTNITRHNDIKIIQPQVLQYGDRIKCGNTVLLVEGLSIPTKGDLNNMTVFLNV